MTRTSNEDSAWPLVRLRDVTVDVPGTHPSDAPDAYFTYVDISSIDNERCKIVEPKRLLGKNAPSRARRPLSEGDVLFSNVRTYLRNVAQVKGLQQPAVASTGFTLLRPTSKLFSRYLYHLARSDFFIGRVTPKQTGTHYPATSDRVVRGQLIPLPDVRDQKMLAQLIDALEISRESATSHLTTARRAIKQFRHALCVCACSGRLTADWREQHPEVVPAATAIEKTRREAREELGSRYREPQLADPNDLPEIPETWTWAALPELGELARGKSRNRPRNAPHLYGGPYPFIQTGDIARSGGKITSHTQEYSEAGLAQSRMWPEKTVCITIAANIADTALLTYPACFPDSVVGLVTAETVVLPEYAEFFLRTIRNNLAAFAPATAQANINIAILSEVAVAVPPIEEQREIIGRVEGALAPAGRVEDAVEAASKRVDRSSQAVLAKVFRGELVTSGVTSEQS